MIILQQKENLYMYVYDHEKNMYVFNGNLEELLLNIGVEKMHIENMKHKLLQPDRGMYHDFPSMDSPERGYISLVPLDKVIGIYRGSVGNSVFENVNTMRPGTREPEGFKGCFDFFYKMSLNELRKSYAEDISPVSMTYYVDEDEYYLHDEGNHRTLTAMLVGAEYIKAKVCNAYLNPEKKKKYECINKFEQTYAIYQMLISGNTLTITFYDDNGYYELGGYPAPEPDENIYSFINRLSKILDEERKTVDRIKKYPSFIRQLFIDKGQYFRIKQLLDIEYVPEPNSGLSGHQSLFYLDKL